MKRLFLFFILILAVNSAVFAAASQDDILVYEGKEYPIQYDLLAEYFKQFPDRRPAMPENSLCGDTSNGYRSTFAVDGTRLYLKDIELTNCVLKTGSVLNKVVPDGERLYLNWVDALIQSSYGKHKMIKPGLVDADSYQQYTFFEVEDGVVKEVRNFSNNDFKVFRQRQAEAYIQTADYKSRAQTVLAANPTFSEEELSKSSPNWVFFYTHKFLVTNSATK